MAAKVKQNANGAVTYLQIVQRRYGTACHIMMSIAALACAHIVTGSLILGASATISSLTGANIIACNFLLPIGIAAYVLLGGLRAVSQALCSLLHSSTKLNSDFSRLFEDLPRRLPPHCSTFHHHLLLRFQHLRNFEPYRFTFENVSTLGRSS